MSSGQDLLQVQGLSRSFSGLRAVNDVDLSIEAGGITGIIGPNGAGKSTFFNLVTRRIDADEGSVRFKGQDITKSRAFSIAQLGLIRSFQISSVFPTLTVQENVLVAVLATDGFSSSMFRYMSRFEKSQTRCDQILEQHGLLSMAEQQCQDLAYGDRRKVEVAMMVALQPTMMLLDEPTAGMGSTERMETAELVRTLSEDNGLTVVLVEHDVDMVFDLARRVVVMHRGQIIADGAPEHIADDPDVREAYLGGQT